MSKSPPPTSGPTPSNLDALQSAHEARVQALVAELGGAGADSDHALARALIHRGVHLAAERRPTEFCALATYLAEMIGHVHGLMHGQDPKSSRHSEAVH
jgi:hypothetical protein